MGLRANEPGVLRLSALFSFARGTNVCINFQCNLNSSESSVAMGTGRTGRGFAVEEGIHAARWQAATAGNNVSPGTVVTESSALRTLFYVSLYLKKVRDLKT